MIAEQELVLVDDIWCRKGTEDHTSIEQVEWCRGLGITSNDRVLELGAHIGCFTKKIALDGGAAYVMAVEADPSNFEVLERNAAEADLLHAIVAKDIGWRTIYTSASNPKASSLYIKSHKRKPVEVKTVTLPDLLERAEPTVMKVDIEGAEYEIGLDQEMPDSLRAIALEIHIDPGSTRRAWFRPGAERIVDSLTRQGFTPDKEVDLDEVRIRRAGAGFSVTTRIERVWSR